MRLRSLVVPSIAILGFACGGTVTGSSAAGTQSSSSAGEGEHSASSSASSSSEPGEARDAGLASVDSGEGGALAGAVYLLTDNDNGTWYDNFQTNLQAMTAAPAAFCADGTSTVGSCCYFGPIPPHPTQTTGSDDAGVAAEPNAGTLTLFDVTAGSTVSTFDYVSGEYATLPMSYTGQPWTPGDVLRVSASGGSTIGAFTFEAPTLAPPSVTMPTTIPRTANLVVSWTPDPDADTWSFSILDGETGAEVACSAPEGAGSVTVDASLLANFAAGNRDQVVATATTVRFAQAPQGRIELDSTGWAGLPYVTFE
jgi:hypothetical protein